MQKTAEDWLKLVQDFEQSGISQVKFCRKHKIPTSSFIYWKQKIAKNNEQIIDAQFIEIPQAHVEAVYPPRKSKPSVNSGISLQIHDVLINIQVGFCPQTMKKILHVLSSEQC